jgi:hypothetical protein
MGAVLLDCSDRFLTANILTYQPKAGINTDKLRAWAIGRHKVLIFVFHPHLLTVVPLPTSPVSFRPTEHALITM